LPTPLYPALQILHYSDFSDVSLAAYVLNSLGIYGYDRSIIF
jgi:hypothetical protein